MTQKIKMTLGQLKNIIRENDNVIKFPGSKKLPTRDAIVSKILALSGDYILGSINDNVLQEELAKLPLDREVWLDIFYAITKQREAFISMQEAERKFRDLLKTIK